MLQKISISNKRGYVELSIHQRKQKNKNVLIFDIFIVFLIK